MNSNRQQRLCEGRVVVVTGAGRGLGRAYALEFARHGASVVVNDLGGRPDGSGGSSASPAADVVEEIIASGGHAVADHHDVADWESARQIVDTAVDRFGRLDVLVNNAGILRDRTLVNLTEDDLDLVVRVHLRGTFATSHWAAVHWRDRSKNGDPVNGRLINTSSSSGLFPNPGQSNYAAVKAGIASMTIVAARELERYGVTANSIYPTAHSRLTETFLQKRGLVDTDGELKEDANRLDPSRLAPFIAWLGSVDSSAVTGQVFGVRGDRIVLAEGWIAGPAAFTSEGWDATTIQPIIEGLVAQARPPVTSDGLAPPPTVAAAG